MPKIIENLESRLLEEAKRQIRELGYSAVTVRSVAKAVGVGIGTVYNYFASKDALLATYMLDDWRKCVEAIHQASACSDTMMPVLECMYRQLVDFAHLHENVFLDEAAVASFAGSFGRYHAKLRAQLAEPLKKFCSDAFTPEFIAEAVLTWSMAGKSFEDICGIVSKLV